MATRKTLILHVAAFTFALLAFGALVEAQTFTVLYSFTGGADGGYPYAGLTRDQAGNLYGTTVEGGASQYGTVFKVDTNGTETVLHNFTAGSDGGDPVGGLLMDNSGTIYGTAGIGGTSSDGVVFDLDTSGTFTVLYNFSGEPDGSTPQANLTRDAAGNLYGTTTEGGAFNWGMIFSVDASGTETVLHSFAGGAGDGAVPYLDGVLRDSKGNFYGVTLDGGLPGSPGGYGVVYRLSNDGTLTILHSFNNSGTDGYYPYGTLVTDPKGHAYGTTESGGSAGEGTIFRITNTGAETVLHNFIGGSSDGAHPMTGVIRDKQGNLYGVTAYGGASDVGTVFKLSPNATLTVLHSFAYSSDGGYPYGSLIRDAKGNLYGTTVSGGSGGYGTVWKLTP